MKHYFLFIILIFSTSINAAITAKKEVLLENEDVKVIRATYPAGSQSGIHTHIYPNRVVYFVKGGTLSIEQPDGSLPARIIKVKDGQTLYMPAATHNVKNIGKNEVVIVETEIKRSHN
jgi:mannose-6-phosphate isomerase-like protein (cupin superfamily)